MRDFVVLHLELDVHCDSLENNNKQFSFCNLTKDEGHVKQDLSMAFWVKRIALAFAESCGK